MIRMHQAKLNLRTLPEHLENLEAALPAAIRSREEIEAVLKAENEKEQNFLKTDPMYPSWEFKYVSFDKIQAWVTKRDEFLADLEARRKPLLSSYREMENQIRSIETQIHCAKSIGQQRGRRLKEALTERRRRQAFAFGLNAPQTMDAFVRHFGEEAFRFFEEEQIVLSGWDEVDRASLKKRSQDDPRRWRERAAVPEPGCLATPKTLSAIYAQFSRELGYPVGKSMADGLVDLWKRSGIKRVLEVGPGTRGFAQVLVDSGISTACALELHSIDAELYGDGERQNKGGIHQIVGNAKEALKFFGSKSMDLIVAMGVLSRGGQAQAEGLDVERCYQACIDESHALCEALVPLLSDNTHSMLVLSSIRGVLTLSRDRLAGHEVSFWRPAPGWAVEAEKARIYRRSPIGYCRLGASHSREEGRAFLRWVSENRTGLDLADRLLEQASDLAIIKRRSRL